MYGAKFDFLTEVTDVAMFSQNIVAFKLSRTTNTKEPLSISGYARVDRRNVSVEVNNTNDPQNSRDIEIEVPCVTMTTVCFVHEITNVLAIEDMPFILTGNQVNTINSFLEDIAQEEMK